MKVFEKLAILADAAKYDASCASSGADKRNSLKTGGIGSNVTDVIQNSSTSALTASGGITVNSGGTDLTNNSGRILTVSTGAIGGTATSVSAPTDYLIRVSNAYGADSTVLRLSVIVPPSGLAYAFNPEIGRAHV